MKCITVIVCACLAFCVICPLVLAVIHSVIMRRYNYTDYQSDRYLVYQDIANQYPRKPFSFTSGSNTLSAYLYGEENEKGVIVIAPGHTDSNDIKLYDMRYFVDAGYSVVGFDYTGYYSSEGKAFGGYTQAVNDLDALLNVLEENPAFRDKPLYLFGHSLGAYAVTAVLNRPHNVRAVVAASGFDTPEEQWQYSVQRFTGFLYPVIKPFNSLFINLKYAEDKNLSAVNGINSVSIPVFVISAEDDIFYGGKSPIYNKRDTITNSNCTFLLMNEENHNGHYDYFLTDAALRYRASNPQGEIDKELYTEHDPLVMRQIIAFYDEAH